MTFTAKHPLPTDAISASLMLRRLCNPLVMAVGMALCLVLCAGCGGSADVNTTYGRRGGYSKTSVNGTSVLARMFEERGHRVSSESNITSSLHKYDLIVWFPQDYEAPTPQQRKFFEAWLRGDDLRSAGNSFFGDDEYDEYEDEYGEYTSMDEEMPFRLLVLVGRDFDAEAYLWGELAKRDKTEKREEYLRREGLARVRHRNSKPYFWNTSTDEYHRWFTSKTLDSRQQVTTLSGEWADDSGVDQTKVAMEYESLLVPSNLENLRADEWSLPYEYVMLEANGEPFVRNVWDEGMINENGIIVINNGSFLLNAPLVNKENRKLAGELITTCEEFSSDDMKVAFLETDQFDNPAEEEDDEAQQSGLEAFSAWPLAPLVWHLTFFGIALCFCLLPIFGRPRQLRQDDQTDFGRHVKAVARLLAGTKDKTYAHRQIQRYRQHANRRD